MPIKCLSVHTATIQNIHSFSLLHCTDTVYTQWSMKNILFILLLLRPGGCECILREPFKIPEMFYTDTVKATSASFIFYLTFIQLGGFKDIKCNRVFDVFIVWMKYSNRYLRKKKTKNVRLEGPFSFFQVALAAVWHFTRAAFCCFFFLSQ